MKKIVFLHPSHWEQAMGGAELQISYLVKYFKNMGHEIHFIYEDQGNCVKNNENIKLHPLKKIRIRKKLGQRWFLYKKTINITLAKIQPDLIYTRLYSSWSGIAAVYSKKNKSMHIWALASDKDVQKKNIILSLFRPFDLIERNMVNKAFYNADRIIAQNIYQQKELFARYNRNSTIVPQMTPLVEETRIKKDAFPLQILWIANLKPLKRPEVFIRLSKKFAADKRCKFLIIGRMGNKYSQLIDSASQELKHFRYLGELSNNKVNDILCRSQILINTSYFEGFSNTFVQAWMRKVVVLSMNSNPNSILTDHKIGFVCPTLKELVEKLELLVSDDLLRADMSNKSYRFAVQNHTFEKNISKVSDLMNL